jgi:all-trans-retinol 13,14-reductase
LRPKHLMLYDAIVIGAGLGGLLSAAKLARNGRKILVLEAKPQVGGTSHIFRRGGYSFPMGPLAFSYPGRVKNFLAEAGIDSEIRFKRNHFQLLTPSFDLIYSLPLKDLQVELKRLFPEESDGIEAFLNELEKLIDFFKDVDTWHPDFVLEPKNKSAIEEGSRVDRQMMEFVQAYSGCPSAQLLDKYFRNAQLKNLLGSQGTSPPQMSLLLLAFMWNVMSEVGIWSPSCGIHGISELLKDAVIKNGGEIRVGVPVEKIFTEDGQVRGVRTARGEMIESRWVIANADLKKTFLELIGTEHIPTDYLGLLKSVPYTASELCVYLGVDPARVDLRRMRAGHLFFRKEIKAEESSDPVDFDNREVEICLWSDHAPDSAPPGRASIVLRVNFPYEVFAAWRTGEKKRKEGYSEYKSQLARKLISTVESALPGLSGAVEIMEIATPLSYRDWGLRYQGSIAGWAHSAELASCFPGKLLIKTPFPNLLLVGIYAASELFLGGVPTSMHTASQAAGYILAS